MVSCGNGVFRRTRLRRNSLSSLERCSVGDGQYPMRRLIAQPRRGDQAATALVPFGDGVAVRGASGQDGGQEQDRCLHDASGGSRKDSKVCRPAASVYGAIA